MVISKTPFRISFFGGGTDFPQWYKENGGVVLSTTIDKYCYISCKVIPPFFDYKHRIVYSKQEYVNSIDEIDHPSVRECFRFMDVKENLEIVHSADLPSKTGIASSSAFTVGLLNAIHSVKGNMVSKDQLYKEAIHIEQDLIKEPVGSQDQVAVAIGGFNKIKFSDEGIETIPIIINPNKIKKIQDNLMLFFTGISRKSSLIESSKIKNIKNKRIEYHTIQQLTDVVLDSLIKKNSSVSFGELLHEYWKVKKKLSNKVSNDFIDDIYDTALKSGAAGGKLLGAGGGGFILFYVEKEKQMNVRKALNELIYVPFKFENGGSHVIYYNSGGAR